MCFFLFSCVAAAAVPCVQKATGTACRGCAAVVFVRQKLPPGTSGHRGSIRSTALTPIALIHSVGTERVATPMATPTRHFKGGDCHWTGDCSSNQTHKPRSFPRKGGGSHSTRGLNWRPSIASSARLYGQEKKPNPRIQQDARMTRPPVVQDSPQGKTALQGTTANNGRTSTSIPRAPTPSPVTHASRDCCHLATSFRCEAGSCTLGRAARKGHKVATHGCSLSSRQMMLSNI